MPPQETVVRTVELVKNLVKVLGKQVYLVKCLIKQNPDDVSLSEVYHPPILYSGECPSITGSNGYTQLLLPGYHDVC